MEKRVLSFSEGCNYLGYKKSYVYKLTSSGVLPYSKPNGKRIYFDRILLEEWMLSNANPSLVEKMRSASSYVRNTAV
jgi:excisionase family DNA binding protein